MVCCNFSLFILNSKQIIVPDDNRRNSTRMYNPMSLVELQKWTDSVNTTSSQSKVNLKKILIIFKPLFNLFCLNRLTGWNISTTFTGGQHYHSEDGTSNCCRNGLFEKSRPTPR